MASRLGLLDRHLSCNPANSEGFLPVFLECLCMNECIQCLETFQSNAWRMKQENEWLISVHVQKQKGHVLLVLQVEAYDNVEALARNMASSSQQSRRRGHATTQFSYVYC